MASDLVWTPESLDRLRAAAGSWGIENAASRGTDLLDVRLPVVHRIEGPNLHGRNCLELIEHAGRWSYCGRFSLAWSVQISIPPRLLHVDPFPSREAALRAARDDRLRWLSRHLAAWPSPGLRQAAVPFENWVRGFSQPTLFSCSFPRPPDPPGRHPTP